MKASSTDPNGNTVSHTYSSSFAGAYATQTNMPDTGSPAVHHVVSGNYDFNTGLLTSFTDQNNRQFTYQYDNMLRLTQSNHPDGGQTVFNYPNATTVERQKKITSSLTDDVLAYFDGVGRGTRTKHVTSGNALVDTTYDALGRAATVTNPYFSTSDLTYGVTRNQYDGLSRVTQTTRQDGGTSTIAYSDNCTTTTDEAGKQRRACSDALGRLTGVWEDPGGLNYETDYQYDALGNLLRVDQKGSAPADSSQWRTRLFAYDSLSRLLTANNPESGTISYVYDANGNLLQKVSPAPNQAGSATHTVSFCYDALNRVTGKAWSWQNCQNGQLPQGTAVVSYTYDQGTNAVGHLSSLADQAGSASYSYDVLGRVSSESRTVAGVTKSMSYTYNLDGSVATATYPSGATITYTPDAAGRALSAIDTTNSINYVTGATYGPTSALTGFVSGQHSGFNGITNTRVYDDRQQPGRRAHQLR
jgi:YD repeat-containing protein